MTSWRQTLEDDRPVVRSAGIAARPSTSPTNASPGPTGRILKLGGGLDHDPPAEALHRLRIDAKKLRYLLEFFHSLYPAPEINARIKELKRLQDILGGFNDMEIQRDTARRFRIASFTPTQDATPSCILTLGRLAGTLEERQEEFRSAFHDAFARFESATGAEPPSKTSSAERSPSEEHRGLDRQGRGREDLRRRQPRPRRRGRRTAARCSGISIPRAPPASIFESRRHRTARVESITKRSVDPAKLARPTEFDNLSMLPADFAFRHLDLALARRQETPQAFCRQARRSRRLLRSRLLDCPPSVSLVSETVVKTVDAVLVPVIPSTLSMRTLHQVRAFVADHGRGAEVLPFLSMVDGRKRMHTELGLACLADPAFLTTAIPSASVVEKMGMTRAPVAATLPSQPAARAFAALWREIRDRLGF